MVDEEKNTDNAQFQLQLPNDTKIDEIDTEKDTKITLNNASVTKTPWHIRRRPQKKLSAVSILFQVIGELMITFGILIGLFILWTVWWSNLTAGNVLDQEATQIQQEFGELPPVKAAAPQEGNPPKVNPVKKGEAIGIIRIPAFGLDNQTAIKEGTDKWILDQGVFSHYPESAMPGDIGNFATAAHRDIYGARLRDVHKLEKGMPVIVETKDAFLVYKIISKEIVKPEDIYTIEPDPFAAKETWKKNGTLPARNPQRRLLTLTTCDPILVASHRYIVYAEFEYWTKRADGLPKELLDEDALKKINSQNAPNNKSFHNVANTQVFTLPEVNKQLRKNFSAKLPVEVKEN